MACSSVVEQVRQESEPQMLQSRQSLYKLEGNFLKFFHQISFFLQSWRKVGKNGLISDLILTLHYEIPFSSTQALDFSKIFLHMSCMFQVLVIGAGPCGLRAAIEAQLLGAKVVVVEKRDRITRNNVLHLWPFVIHDLKALGAKKFFGRFCAGAIDHISESEERFA